MRQIQRAVIGAVAAVVCAATDGGTVLFVDDDALPGGDGGGWSTALRHLQDALSIAATLEVSEIRVAAGTYRPDLSNANPGGTGDREAVFELLSGLALRGGYAGVGAPDPNDRDPAVYETVLSGDLAGDDQPDFTNRNENSFHVLDGSDTDASAVLDGFIVTGGYADAPGVPQRNARGGGLFIDNGSPTVTGCVFRGNAVISGFNENGGGAVFVTGGDATFTDCVFQGNRSGHGGAVHIRECAVGLLDGCTFTDNVADIGAGVRTTDVTLMTITGCTFFGNTANAAAGGVLAFRGDELRVLNSSFIANTGELAIGGLGTCVLQFDVVNCVFAENETSDLGGGIETVSMSSKLTNCVFSRNTATFGGGAFTYFETVVTNCTFSDNTANSLANEYGYWVTVRNSILWGSPEPIGGGPGGSGGGAAITSSDVEGGWAGTGNIDADPLFVQPGTDDVRLAFGSPCVNAGNNALLPPDDLDLDGDGNTTEPIPYDLGGNDRVQGGTVDMGAWEGEFEPGAPASGESNLDQGEFVVLVPEGGQFNPLESPVVIVSNTSGPDNASFLVTQLDEVIHPGAGGFTELGAILRTETSLADGQYVANVFVPFDAGDLAGSMAQQLSLTYFDEAVGNWAFAPSGNSQSSPGFGGPIGNRIVELQGGAWGITQELGDYGVFWDPQLQQGFVWANVAHEADFGVGFAFCPSDCLQTPDGLIGIQDMLALLSLWGAEAGGGPCDANFDGVIDVIDFGALLGAWGSCEDLSGSAPARGAPAVPMVAMRSPDLDGDSVVDREDLIALKASWGECEGDCPGDLNGDGRVGVADHLLMFAHWGPVKQ